MIHLQRRQKTEIGNQFEIHGQKFKSKEVDTQRKDTEFSIPMWDGRKIARRARGATSDQNFKKSLQKGKEEPEIQVRILKFDKICEVQWGYCMCASCLRQGRH